MYLFFDTETTGVKNDPRIVQLGWTVTDENGNELRSQCFIVRPDGFDIPFSATGIHGITTETARRSGVEIGAVLEAFARDVLTATFLIAHNVHFDRNIVCDELQRIGREDILTGKELYCTMRSSKEFCKIDGRRGYKWPSLEELHISLFGITFDEAHHALADARACAKCFFELKRKGVSIGIQVSVDEITSDEDEEDDYQAYEDEELLEEIEGMEEFLRDSERTWVDRFYAQFQRTRRLSEKQRDILFNIRSKLEDRM